MLYTVISSIKIKVKLILTNFRMIKVKKKNYLQQKELRFLFAIKFI